MKLMMYFICILLCVCYLELSAQEDNTFLSK